MVMFEHMCSKELSIDSLESEFAENYVLASDYRLRSMIITFKEGTKGAATNAVGIALKLSRIASSGLGQISTAALSLTDTDRMAGDIAHQ